MNTRKLSVAMAAMLLGLQVGSPSLAAVTEGDLVLVESYVLNGQVEELAAILVANPELLQLSGVLGDALRAFIAAPSLATLQAVALVTNGQIAVALLNAVDPRLAGDESLYSERFDDDGDDDNSIY